MSKSDFLENAILNLIFQGTAIPNLADDAAASPAANWYWALHTADPTEAGQQTANEATYAGYARVAVARPAGMTVSTTGVTHPAANILFPVATGPDLPDIETITHFSIGYDETGAGEILYSGTIDPVINISTGVQPSFTTASAVSED